MEELDRQAAIYGLPATGEQQEPSTAAPTVPPSVLQQAVPSPVEGQRNYGYPDDFMMYCFKVEPCTRTDKHPRGSCPFAHAGDVARRRHPSRYQALLCPEVRAKKACPRLDDCQCSHSAFEFWLHPDRYRTSICEKGSACTRPVCFFAHSEEELRPLPQGLKPADPEPSPSASSKRRISSSSSRPSPSVAGIQTPSVGGGLQYLHQQQQQQQPQLLMQPGMQLVQVNPAAAGAAAPGFTPVGYMPMVQQGVEPGLAVPYGQMPGGVVMMSSNQPQQYIMQQPLQQAQQQQSLEKQFQGLAVASGAMVLAAEPTASLGGSNPWQQQQQQLLQQQQPLMMMPVAGMPGTPVQTAMQYPQQQMVYMPSPAEQGSWGYGHQHQTQQQQGPGVYSSATGNFGGSYMQYGAPSQPAQYSSGGAGIPAVMASNPAGAQGGNLIAGTAANPGLLAPGSGAIGSDAGSLGPHAARIRYGSLQGQPHQHEGPGWG